MSTSGGQTSVSPERRFFELLGRALPGQVLYNGDGGAAAAWLDSLGLELPNAHWQMALPPALAAALDDLLISFGGTHRGWQMGDLRPQLSGVITGPPLGRCVVQWDGAEHFNPYRLSTLRRLGELVGPRFPLRTHAGYCISSRHFAAFWQSSKLPATLLPGGPPPTGTGQFAAVLARLRRRLGGSSYVRPVAGFRFVGGRIAQRAYHDALLDCAHLAAAWQRSGVLPVLRVAVWDVVPEPDDSGHQADFEGAAKGLMEVWRQGKSGGLGNTDAGDRCIRGRRS